MVLSSEEMRRKSVVRRNFQTQRRKGAEFSFTNTKCARETEVFRISCFRHLEKPIKTREYKIKHLPVGGIKSTHA